MTSPAPSRWLALPILVLSLCYCQAQAPSGPVNFAFTSASTAVYDLSGSYRFDQDILGPGGTPVPLSLLDLSITHDSTGKLRGSGFIMVTIGTDSFVGASYSASGQVSGGGNTPTKVILSVHLSGNDVVAGQTTALGIFVRYNLTVDAASGALTGTARGQVAFAQLSAGRISSDNVSVPLPAGVDGSWSAQVSILPLRRLSGAGAVVLSNGRTLPVNATGAFSVNTGVSSLRLSGVPRGNTDGRGTLLKMNFLTDAVHPDLLSGKIMGQKVVQ